MKKLGMYIYNKNYLSKLSLCIIISIIICVLIILFNDIFVINLGQDSSYHINIITINSILSGFSLTNLGILISISDEQLVKKLEGTDVLVRRNTVISHSIIFGVISIVCALLFILKSIYSINIPVDLYMFKKILKTFIFNVEMLSLIFSIFYFLLSIKEMIKLLSYIYVPKQKLSYDKICEIKEQMEKSISHLQ